MDEIARYNAERWKALAAANALFTRPLTDLSMATARQMVDADGTLGDLTEKLVLCLAGGGGRQSAAFGLLGANVTVVDLSEDQLERDREMAAHYGIRVQTIQGDMRDLSMFEAATFDVVHQPYSLNFVPDAREVFAQVARIIRMSGRYDVMCANPFAAGMTERDWNGEGYSIRGAYVQGERISYNDQDWVYERGENMDVPPPQEFRQTLGTLMNGLAENGFVLRKLEESGSYQPDMQAEPGTWDHFSAVLPPWLTISAVYRPDVFIRA